MKAKAIQWDWPTPDETVGVVVNGAEIRAKNDLSDWQRVGYVFRNDRPEWIFSDAVQDGDMVEIRADGPGGSGPSTQFFNAKPPALKNVAFVLVDLPEPAEVPKPKKKAGIITAMLAFLLLAAMPALADTATFAWDWAGDYTQLQEFRLYRLIGTNRVLTAVSPTNTVDVTRTAVGNFTYVVVAAATNGVESLDSNPVTWSIQLPVPGDLRIIQLRMPK